MATHLGPFDAAAVVIVGAALLSYLNHRFLRLPISIGLALMGLLLSIALLGADAAFPQAGLAQGVRSFLDDIDFKATLLDGMLAFLLFAGALHARDYFRVQDEY